MRPGLQPHPVSVETVALPTATVPEVNFLLPTNLGYWGGPPCGGVVNLYLVPTRLRREVWCTCTLYQRCWSQQPGQEVYEYTYIDTRKTVRGALMQSLHV